MSYRRRVAMLEARYPMITWETLSPLHREWVHQFDITALDEALAAFARTFAAMRYTAEGRFPDGARTGHVDDWREVTTEAERDALTDAEYERLYALMEEQGYVFEEALSEWCETANREGWPRLAGPVYGIDRAGFAWLFQMHRIRGDEARLRNDPPSTLWRREHPSWRPGMTILQTLDFQIRTRARMTDEIVSH